MAKKSFQIMMDPELHAAAKLIGVTSGKSIGEVLGDCLLRTHGGMLLRIVGNLSDADRQKLFNNFGEFEAALDEGQELDGLDEAAADLDELVRLFQRCWTPTKNSDDEVKK